MKGKIIMYKRIEKFEKFFASEKTLRVTVILTLLFYSANLVVKITGGLYTYFVLGFAFLLCIGFLYYAYLTHSKNVQKGLFGAVLMWYFYDEVSFVFSGIVFNRTVFLQYDNFCGKMYLILSIATMILYAVLFVNHFVISGNHSSRTGNVFLNQLLIIVIALFSLASGVFQAHVLKGDTVYLSESLTWHAGLACFVLMIASYEALFDSYKIKREKR